MLYTHDDYITSTFKWRIQRDLSLFRWKKRGCGGGGVGGTHARVVSGVVGATAAVHGRRTTGRPDPRVRPFGLFTAVLVRSIFLVRVVASILQGSRRHMRPYRAWTVFYYL